MRKHGWQLPYHPLQVVAVAVFLSLGFAFYVFFAPFIGRKLFQYIVIGLYTPLITCVFGLYIWCTAADPADSGVLKSKKYLNIPDCGKSSQIKNSKFSGESKVSMHNPNAFSTKGKAPHMNADENPKASSEIERKSSTPTKRSSCFLLRFSPCGFLCNFFSSSKETPDGEMSEDGIFYCSLCQAEVHKCSKHCRVCDKCVDHFDHHCRWLNNCIGQKNYRQFFTLMVTSLLLVSTSLPPSLLFGSGVYIICLCTLGLRLQLILQWTTGVLVLLFCFLEKKRFSSDISSKLGSSFSFAPFVIVVGVCTILAMTATLPLAQLFFFHILLIKKGISTYDYIIILRELEQEQVGGTGQQSPPMSVASSLTGLSSASSFTNFNRAVWCTPPRLFLEDQFDVVPPETGSVSSLGKNTAMETTAKKKNHPHVKISPWILARMNAEEASKAAGEARKKSNILQPVARTAPSYPQVVDSGFGNSGRRVVPRLENNRRRSNKRVRLPADLTMDPMSKVSLKAVDNALAPLQLEARSAFQTSRGMSSSAGVVVSSPESSLNSPDIQPFRASSSGAEDARRLMDLRRGGGATEKEIPLTRSTSDGYEPSGGEDSDQVPSKVVKRWTEWSNMFGSGQGDMRRL